MWSYECRKKKFFLFFRILQIRRNFILFLKKKLYIEWQYLLFEFYPVARLKKGVVPLTFWRNGVDFYFKELNFKLKIHIY